MIAAATQNILGTPLKCTFKKATNPFVQLLHFWLPNACTWCNLPHVTFCRAAHLIYKNVWPCYTTPRDIAVRRFTCTAAARSLLIMRTRAMVWMLLIDVFVTNWCRHGQFRDITNLLATCAQRRFTIYSFVLADQLCSTPFWPQLQLSSFSCTLNLSSAILYLFQKEAMQRAYLPLIFRYYWVHWASFDDRPDLCPALYCMHDSTGSKLFPVHDRELHIRTPYS